MSKLVNIIFAIVFIELGISILQIDTTFMRAIIGGPLLFLSSVLIYEVFREPD